MWLSQIKTRRLWHRVELRKRPFCVKMGSRLRKKLGSAGGSCTKTGWDWWEGDDGIGQIWVQGLLAVYKICPESVRKCVVHVM